MGMVFRKYACDFGHTWKDLVERGAPSPAECPVCAAIVAEALDPAHYPARARSDTVEAPALRGERTKAVARFEAHAFKRPHFDDGSPLLTNLKDNNREGDVAAVIETPRSNEALRIMTEMQQRSAQPASPWGWQPAGNPAHLVGGDIAGRLPTVDLQSKNRPP